MKTARIGRAQMGLIVLVILLFTALYLHQELNVAGAFGFPLDDAWIHCQFARNIARGYGMSYNPGVPVSGSTAPLWTLMLAESYLVSPNLIFGAKLMSLVLYALSCVLVFKILVFILSDARFAFLGAVLTAMISTLMWGALSGMEVMLSAFLTLAGIYLYLLHRRERGPKHYASTVLFVLASLARPESMLLVFIALADSFILGRIEKRETLGQFAKRAAVHLLLFFALLSPYIVFNYLSGGGPFPTTFAAKRGGGLVVLLSRRDTVELRKMVFLYPRLYLARLLDLSAKQNVLLYWLMFVGAIKIVVDSFRAKTENRALVIPLTFLVYPMIVGIVAPNKVALEWMSRYMGNLTPLYVIMGVTGLHVAVSFLRSSLAELWVGKETARKLTRAALAAVVLVLLVSQSIEEYENSKFYAQGVQNINAMQVAIGRWMKENSSPDALLAVNDIGGIAYFSERRIIDLVGLVTPEAVSYRQKKGGTFEFIALKKPDYVIIFPTWFPELPTHRELTPVFRVTLEINAVCGAPVMVVYRTAWANERKAGILPPAQP